MESYFEKFREEGIDHVVKIITIFSREESCRENN